MTAKIFFLNLLLVSVGEGQIDQFMAMSVLVDGGVEFVITDPQGRRSGFDISTGTRYDEINKSYGVMSIDSEDPDIDPPESSMEFATQSPLNGEYLLLLQGTKLAKYELCVDLIQDLGKSVRFEYSGVIDSSGLQVFFLNYSSVIGDFIGAEREIEGKSLRTDLDNCYKLNLLGKKPLYIDLDHRVSKYEKYIEKEESAKARHELEKLDKKLDEVYKRTSKGKSADPNHFIKEDAYRILKEDVKRLMEGH